MTDKKRSSGSTSERARQFNERMILQCVRQHGEISRAQLARMTSLSAQTISVITSALIKSGLLKAVGREYGGRGQPSIKLALNPEGAFGVGINIDRDHVSTMLVDFSGNTVMKEHHELLYPQVGQTMALVMSDLERMEQRLGSNWQQVRGIGLAMPRKMASWLQELRLSEEPHPEDESLMVRFSEWNHVDFPALLRKETELEVFSENDAGAASLGELYFGLGHQYENYFYLFLGMSLGGGIISDGQYFRGVTGNAADFGLIPLCDAQGKPHRPLLSEVSLAALYRFLGTRGVSVSSTSCLEALIGQQQEQYVDEWIEKVAPTLVAPLSGVVATLDTEVVIFGGRLPTAILSKLMKRVSQLAEQWLLPEQQLATMVLSETGPDAAVAGAAILPLYDTYMPMRERLLLRS